MRRNRKELVLAIIVGGLFFLFTMIKGPTGKQVVTTKSKKFKDHMVEQQKIQKSDWKEFETMDATLNKNILIKTQTQNSDQSVLHDDQKKPKARILDSSSPRPNKSDDIAKIEDYSLISAQQLVEVFPELLHGRWQGKAERKGGSIILLSFLFQENLYQTSGLTISVFGWDIGEASLNRELSFKKLESTGPSHFKFLWDRPLFETYNRTDTQRSIFSFESDRCPFGSNYRNAKFTFTRSRSLRQALKLKLSCLDIGEVSRKRWVEILNMDLHLY